MKSLLALLGPERGLSSLGVSPGRFELPIHPQEEKHREKAARSDYWSATGRNRNGRGGRNAATWGFGRALGAGK